MFDFISGFLWDSWRSGFASLSSIVTAGLFFFFIGLLVKGRALFSDIRRAAGETGLNVKIILFNIVVLYPVLVILSQGLTTFVRDQGWVLVDPATWQGIPMLLVIFLAVFVGDFVGYWRHRLEHSSLFWPSHAVHHSDTEMTFLTVWRFHPINRITTVVIDSAALLVLALPAEAVIANGLVRHYYGYFIHANLPWTYGPLGRIFVSPAMHRWHHATDKAAYNTNYASIFSIFDQVFGTYRVPGRCTAPLGVTDKIAPTLRSQMTYSLTPGAYRGLFRTRTKARIDD